MSLEKLIEDAFDDTVSADPHTGNLCGKKDFFDIVRQILSISPTCEVEQRKFLYEIKTKFEIFNSPIDGKFRGLISKEFQHSFLDKEIFECDLSKVIEGE
jgi:hypothetical protein